MPRYEVGTMNLGTALRVYDAETQTIHDNVKACDTDAGRIEYEDGTVFEGACFVLQYQGGTQWIKNPVAPTVPTNMSPAPDLGFTVNTPPVPPAPIPVVPFSVGST